MFIVRIIQFLLQHRQSVIMAFCSILGLLALGDALLVDKTHAHTWIEKFPAFWSLFGFVSCVVIILISKWFGHSGIMTREDYYDE